LRRRPRPKLGCGAKEGERGRERNERIILKWILKNRAWAKLKPVHERV
jgi:hypothetical protein